MKLWRFSLRYLARNYWQTILLVIGIMLGVAVVVAIDFSNASAKIALDLSTQSLVGKSTHQIIAANGGIEETVFVKLKNERKLEYGSPVVEGYITVPAWQDRALLLMGIDPILDYQIRDIYGKKTEVLPQLINSFSQPLQVILSKDLAAQYSLSLGQKLSVEFEGKQFNLEIVGLAASQDPLAQQSLNGLIIMDIGSAQELLNRQGLLDRIDVRLTGDQEIITLRDFFLKAYS